MVDQCSCSACGAQCQCNPITQCQPNCPGGSQCQCHSNETHKCPSCQKECECSKSHLHSNKCQCGK